MEPRIRLMVADDESDYREALALARSSHPDVILLDLSMPKLDGFEVLERLRLDPVTADIPVLVLSARRDDAGKVSGLRLGAVDYLEKPCSVPELRARLETERLGQVAHELRNKLHTAMLAFHVLKSGTVGVGGSTGAVLGRSLLGLKELADSTLAEVRLAGTHPGRERVQLKAFLDELAITANLYAEYHGIAFMVATVDPDLVVAVDLPLLTTAVTNLLQNAFKYTTAHSTVTLRTRGEHGRVFLEVEDECGGMQVPQGTDPFRAPRVPRADGRSGLGLGLSICRKAVEANGGQVRTRSLPGRGCIFEIELPAAAQAA